MAQDVTNPKVTVLMPVYNGERYLHNAIESILNQTFTDFEFIIINDGSSDRSASIIESFKDERIRLINNAKNIGIVETLNKGIDLALGEYIARMDSDDISLPQRLQKEVDVLQRNENISLVASHFIVVDEEGKNTGSWPPGIKFETNKEIRRALSKENCIGHPSVLIRTAILRKYGYRKEQPGAEDWDLWLRMASDGRIFFKINEILLIYRVHKASITITRDHDGEYINKYRVLFRYSGFKIRQLRFNGFDLRVFFSGISNYFKHLLSQISPKIPAVFSAIFGGKIFKAGMQLLKIYFLPATKDTSVFLFIPLYGTKQNGDGYFSFLELFMQKKVLVFITDENNHAGRNQDAINIAATAYIPYMSNLAKRMIAKRIMKAENPIIIGYDSTFFYHLLVYLGTGTESIDIIKENMNLNEYHEELIYNYGVWAIPFIERLSKRIIVGKKTLEDVKELYLSTNKAPELLHRLECVDDINEAAKIILT